MTLQTLRFARDQMRAYEEVIRVLDAGGRSSDGAFYENVVKNYQELVNILQLRLHALGLRLKRLEGKDNEQV